MQYPEDSSGERYASEPQGDRYPEQAPPRIGTPLRQQSQSSDQGGNTQIPRDPWAIRRNCDLVVQDSVQAKSTKTCYHDRKPDSLRIVQDRISLIFMTDTRYSAKASAKDRSLSRDTGLIAATAITKRMSPSATAHAAVISAQRSYRCVSNSRQAAVPSSRQPIGFQRDAFKQPSPFAEGGYVRGLTNGQPSQLRPWRAPSDLQAGCPQIRADKPPAIRN